MPIGEVRIQLDRSLRRSMGFYDRLFSFFRRKTRVVGGVSQRVDRQLRKGERVMRVKPDCLLVVADRFAGILEGAAIVVKIPLQKGVVGLDILVRRRGRGG